MVGIQCITLYVTDQTVPNLLEPLFVGSLRSAFHNFLLLKFEFYLFTFFNSVILYIYNVSILINLIR